MTDNGNNPKENPKKESWNCPPRECRVISEKEVSEVCLPHTYLPHKPPSED